MVVPLGVRTKPLSGLKVFACTLVKNSSDRTSIRSLIRISRDEIRFFLETLRVGMTGINAEPSRFTKKALHRLDLIEQ